MEIIKSYRFFKLSIQGLPKASLSTYKFAYKMTRAYRLNRKMIIRDMHLGYWS